VEEPGGEGELHVKASTVAIGYWRDEKRTRERFIADPRISGSPVSVYRTGDIVRIDEKGNLIFSGRKDHLVKSRGYRIELEEIEVVLNSHPSVRQAVAIPIPDEMIGNRILACVSCDDKVEPVEEEIIQHCSRLLPQYMVPESIRFYKKLPESMNGKIDRKILLTTLQHHASN
jgi:acyl-coenzyme A synthetase/AMP-(fatty) acid ligase